MYTTPVTLLDDLINAPSQRLWTEFYDIYWKAILNFCLKRGLDESDSRDVLQESMLAFYKHLVKGNFKYDKKKGKFRNLIFTIVRNKANDAYRRSKLRATISLDAILDQGCLFFDEGLAPDEIMEKDWQFSLLETALERLYEIPELERSTLDIFVDYAIRDLSASEVAEKYQIKENAVYQIKNRITKRLKNEIDILNKISEKFCKI